MWTKSKHKFYTHFFFPKNCGVYEVTRKRKKIECNIPFPQQLWIGKRATILRYTYTASLAELPLRHYDTNIFRAALGLECDQQEQNSQRLYCRLCLKLNNFFEVFKTVL
jgi:hypothetical protein